MKTFVEMPNVGLVYNRYRKASPTQDAVIEMRVFYMRNPLHTHSLSEGA